MQLVRALFFIIILCAPLSGTAVQSAWTGHPQYVVIRSKEESTVKESAKEKEEKSAQKPRRAPAPPDEEEYYDDDDDDLFDFAPPTEEEMANIFESLSQVFAMNGPGNNALMPPLQ